MKIYGHFMSPPTNQARLTASAVGVAHEYVHIDLTKGAHRAPEYLAINPYGRVPALVDGDLKLAESCAISRYLASKAKSDLYPEDVAERAIVDQWMDYAAHHIRANMGRILFNRVVAPLMGVEVDERSIKEGGQALDANMPIVDAQLAKSRYVAGGRMTIADTAMTAAMEPFEMLGYSIENFPNVVRWRNAIMAEPFYKKVHDRYGAEMAA